MLQYPHSKEAVDAAKKVAVVECFEAHLFGNRGKNRTLEFKELTRDTRMLKLFGVYAYAGII